VWTRWADGEGPGVSPRGAFPRGRCPPVVQGDLGDSARGHGDGGSGSGPGGPPVDAADLGGSPWAMGACAPGRCLIGTRGYHPLAPRGDA